MQIKIKKCRNKKIWQYLEANFKKYIVLLKKNDIIKVTVGKVVHKYENY